MTVHGPGSPVDGRATRNASAARMSWRTQAGGGPAGTLLVAAFFAGAADSPDPVGVVSQAVSNERSRARSRSRAAAASRDAFWSVLAINASEPPGWSVARNV